MECTQTQLNDGKRNRFFSTYSLDNNQPLPLYRIKNQKLHVNTKSIKIKCHIIVFEWGCNWN